MGKLMEELEMMVGVVGSRVGELASGAGVGLGLWEDGNRNGTEGDSESDAGQEGDGRSGRMG